MLKSLTFFLVLLGLSGAAISAADGKALALVTEVIFNVPAHSLSTEGAPKLKPLPKTAMGEERLDALEFLNGWGVTTAPGKLAVYLPSAEALVLMASAEDQELVGRMLEPCCGTRVSEAKTLAEQKKRLIDEALNGLRSK